MTVGGVEGGGAPKKNHTCTELTFQLVSHYLTLTLKRGPFLWLSLVSVSAFVIVIEALQFKAWMTDCWLVEQGRNIHLFRFEGSWLHKVHCTRSSIAFITFSRWDTILLWALIFNLPVGQDFFSDNIWHFERLGFQLYQQFIIKALNFQFICAGDFIDLANIVR